MFLNLDSLQTNMDTYFALRHADELENYNIARSALQGLRDVTSNQNATSIAVDNGSLDFFNYGTTSTTEADDCPSESVCASNPSYLVDKRLDIGYHYLISKEYPYEDHYGLYHPLEIIESVQIDEDDNSVFEESVDPTIELQHHMDIESVFEPGSEDEKTIVVYRSEVFDENMQTGHINEDTERFMFYRFRDDSGWRIKWGVIDKFEVEDYHDPTTGYDYQFDPNIYAIAITSTHKVDRKKTDGSNNPEYDYIHPTYPEPSREDEEGQIYAACIVMYSTTQYDDEYGIWEALPDVKKKAGLYIYRYDPIINQPNKWIKIAYKELLSPTPGTEASDYFYDVGLCARNNNLWIVWSNKHRSSPFTYQIKCVYIESPMDIELGDPVIIQNEIDLKDEIGNSIIDCIYTDDIQVDLTWDDTTDMYGTNNKFKGNPRLICRHNSEKIKSGKIDIYVEGAPYQTVVNLYEVKYEPGVATLIPSISSNDYSQDKGFSTITKRAFGSFWHPKAQYSQCNFVSTDTWTTPEDIPGPLNFSSSSLPDTTYRGFGTDRYVFKYSGTILTNTEVLDLSVGGVNSERINTNSTNLTDVFTSYADYETIFIRHIDP